MGASHSQPQHVGGTLRQLVRSRASSDKRMKSNSSSYGEEEKPFTGIAKVLNILVKYFVSVSFPFFLQPTAIKWKSTHQ